MSTISILEKELKQAQLRVKIGKAATILINAFLNRNSFRFTDMRNEDRFLFRNDKFYNCFDHLKLSDVKHFEEIYKIIFDRKCDFTKDLKRALTLIEKHKDISSKIVSDIANELIQ